MFTFADMIKVNFKLSLFLLIFSSTNVIFTFTNFK